jgi:4-amino-4-deoxy-L-arabinose transferase-like glycosyltransferase
MKQASLPLPVLGLIAGTRGMLGTGIGLLLFERMDPRQRRAVGWTLLAVGVLTTLPLLFQVRGGLREQPPAM